MPLPLLALALPAASTALSTWIGGGAAVALTTLLYKSNQASKERVKLRAYENGRNVSRAEYDLKLQQFQEQMQALREQDTEYFRSLLAIVRCAYAHAHERGRLNRNTRRDIDEFFLGQLGKQLPAAVRDRLDQSYADPATPAQSRQWAAQRVSLQMLTELDEVMDDLVP